MRESFIFYKSFYESIKELDEKHQVEIYNAIFEYEFLGKYPELTGISKSIFTLIIPQLEANNKRYENGKKGGRPKKENNQTETKTKPNNNQTETKVKPNKNDNENDNVNVNNNILIVEQVIDYMNELAGTSFKKSTTKTQSLIKARLKEGFTLDDLKDVVYYKYNEWYKNPITFKNGISSSTYFRPNTLFSTNFEEYLETYKREYK